MRAVQSAKFTSEGSVGSGLTPTVFTRRKRPVRARSAATTSLTDCGCALSPARGMTAIGIWRPPDVVMSIVSCGCARGARASSSEEEEESSGMWAWGLHGAV